DAPGVRIDVLLSGVDRAEQSALSFIGGLQARTPTLAPDLAAARSAWDDAKLPQPPPPASRIGVVVGTSRGPVGTWMESFERLNKTRMLPTLAANSNIVSVGGTLAIALKAHGPTFTVSAACASSAHAIAVAAQQILLGTADVMLAGGTEASLHPLIVAQLLAAGILGEHTEPTKVCRPFARDRNGTILGEGAAFLVLEPARLARARGAKIHAWLAGWSVATEAYQRTGISESAHGMQQVMLNALAMAGLAPEQIGYVNVHGTGTVLGDAREARALRSVFPRTVPCSSTKPVTGHCMGATSALEAVISILALQQGLLPPTPNCLPLDPACELDIVHTAPRPAPVRAVMCNSAGFWGCNASLIFTAPT
ncbi:MAG: beta-ketoacyl-[acyl-carrier-protein] synthase family protein, partial [Verrucomicrobiae bacterium]|nr:beta-ketoacyl-[acyl-carrier-protein] synthase family protein [Verrucomicrobiae bacterium]